METVEMFNAAIRKLSPEGNKALIWALKQAVRQFHQEAARHSNEPAIIRRVLLDSISVMRLKAEHQAELETLIFEITAENVIQITEVR